MGFFDWVMHGLGFEDSGSKKDKKSKTAVAEADEKYADFNLHEKIDADKSEQGAQEVNPGFNNFGMQTNSNIIMVEPVSRKDIQKVVDYLKQGQSVAVNLEGIANEDRARILDFLSGALYGLNGSIHRWHGDYFLLAPEGLKILRPTDK